MKLHWKLSKKQGNFRLVLDYRVELSEFECGLAMPAIIIDSAIPKPPEESWLFCWPGEHERQEGWKPSSWYQLMTPSHKSRVLQERLKLPWCPAKEYEEMQALVCASFVSLREAFERGLRDALHSGELIAEAELETSRTMRRESAPAFMARRILHAVS